MLIFIQHVLLNGTLTKSSQSITSFLNTTLPHYKIRNDNKKGKLLAITPWIFLSYKAPKHKFNIRTICRNWVKFHACIKFWRFYLQLAVDIKNYKVLVTGPTCTCIGEMKFSNKPDFNCSIPQRYSSWSEHIALIIYDQRTKANSNMVLCNWSHCVERFSKTYHHTLRTISKRVKFLLR